MGELSVANSFEGHPVIITEERLQDLVNKEKKLEVILAAYPELVSGQKLTPAAKRYKGELASFVKRVEEILNSEDIGAIFQIAHVHGFPYKGPSLAKDIDRAKKVLGK
jgi:hypothetical protein